MNLDMKEYYQIELEFLAPENGISFREDIMRCSIEDYGALGVEECQLNEEEIDKLYGGPVIEAATEWSENFFERFENELSQTLKVFFENHEKAIFFLEMIDNNYSERIKAKLECFENKDWNHEWRKAFSPFEVKNLEIIPSWMRSDWKNKAGFQSLYIYPGQGFGTGQHETTQLCLELAQNFCTKIQNGSTLDFGCGSGILGIAHSLLFGESVHFYDISEDAMENTRVNLKHNDINFEGDESSIKFLEKKNLVLLKNKYDTVYANILSSVLIPYKNLLVDLVQINGFLILSGILVEEQEDLINAFMNIPNRKLVAVRVETKNSWLAVIFKRLK